MSSLLRPHSHRTDREETNTSILKNKKLGADAVQQKKHALTQEFKELYRERNVQVAEEVNDIPKAKEHKLRHALDSLLGENKTRDNRLNELKLRLNIMKRDDISGIEAPEKAAEQKFSKTVGTDFSGKKTGFEGNGETQKKDGKDLVEKYAVVKKTLDDINNKREMEEETQRMLDAKIGELIRSQKVLTDRIGKQEALYDMMEKRFLNLGKLEFAAKNKLTRTSNKLLSTKKDLEKQKTHEDEYFNLKRTVLKRSHSAVAGYKDTIAKNLIYMEEIRLRKDEVDEKLEEVNYEEKQIISKREASEYILLYIDLLESLENEFLKKNGPRKAPKLATDNTLQEKPKSPISAEADETPRKLYNTSESRSTDLEKRTQNLSDTNKDRDAIIMKIAQFYDQHPRGTNALVNTLLKLYHDMQLNEQSLSIKHQDLTTDRLHKQNEIEKLESTLAGLQQGFILMEEEPDNDEEASPEHVRERERKVAGKLSQYDLNTVRLGEYLVNLCANGIQDMLFKLSNASKSLAIKSGKRVPDELVNKASEIEGFLGAKNDFSVPELPMGRNRSVSKGMSGLEEGSAKDFSLSIRPRTISLTTSSPMESVINLQKADQQEEKNQVGSRTDDVGKTAQSQQQLASEEFTKVEQLFKSCIPGAGQELVYRWNEKMFQAKWILDYLSKEDIKKVLSKYTYYYGADITYDLLKSIVKDLKSEARLSQRKRTSEAFGFTEELLVAFENHYKKRKRELCKQFDTDIKSEILDDLNHVLAVSEHVEKVHGAKCQNLVSEPVEEVDVWRKTEEKQNSDSGMELISLRAKTPEAVFIRTTREAVSDLHSQYLKERRGLSSSHGGRSKSASKVKVVISKKRKESFDSSDEEDMMVDQKALLNSERREQSHGMGFSKRMSAPCITKNQESPTDMDRGTTEEDREGSGKKMTAKKTELRKEEKKVVPIPSVFYKAQKKSKNVEEFKKKIIKDEEILRKIALLEKRQTEFDRKSTDYEKRRDYVPNFSLLQRFDLGREKNRDQIIQEWWKRQDAGILDSVNREPTPVPAFIISTSRKDDKSPIQFSQQPDSARNILISQKRRSSSRAAVRPWVLPEEGTAQTSRPDTGNTSKGKRSVRKRRDSFDDLENKLFNSAVSQNKAILEAEVYKL